MTTPAGSGVTNKGTEYQDGSQVTSTNLNDIVDDAVFNNNAVDGVTLGLNADTPKALFVNNQGIDTAQLKDNAVTTAKITDANVTTAKIADNAITTGKIIDNAVTPAKTSFCGTVDTTADSTTLILSKQDDGDYDSVTPSGDVTMTQAGAFTIQDDAVTTAKIINNAITTAKITDNNVTLAKVEQLADQKVVANFTGSTANASETGLVIGGSGSDGLLFDNDDLLDNDDTSGGSATRGATQQSIKAYVDSIKPNIASSTKLDAATLSVTKSTYVDFPTLETAITSRYENTKFIVTGFVSCGFHNNSSDGIVKAQYKVGSGAYQDFNLATGVGNRVAGHFSIGQNADNNTGINSEAFSIPTPAITNSAGDVITFKLQVTLVNGSETLYINREEQDDSNDDSTRRVISTLTVQEV